MNYEFEGGKRGREMLLKRKTKNNFTKIHTSNIPTSSSIANVGYKKWAANNLLCVAAAMNHLNDECEVFQLHVNPAPHAHLNMVRMVDIFKEIYIFSAMNFL